MLSCVGQIHDEDLLDATPRHVTVISPIRPSGAEGYVQYGQGPGEVGMWGSRGGCGWDSLGV